MVLFTMSDGSGVTHIIAHQRDRMIEFREESDGLTRVRCYYQPGSESHYGFQEAWHPDGFTILTICDFGYEPAKDTRIIGELFLYGEAESRMATSDFFDWVGRVTRHRLVPNH